jgi:hypothetical protein
MLATLFALLLFHPAPGPPAGSAKPSLPAIPLSACADLLSSGSYYLTKDVSSPGTCFFIDADHITLDLRGHTITYGTGGGPNGTPGILLADDWYVAHGLSLAKTGTAGHHGGFVVFGGSLLSAPNAAPQSRGIWVGESNRLSPAPVIHDLVITTYAPDANPIFGTHSVSGWRIYNNTLSYKSNSISSRYAFFGYALWLGDSLDSSGKIPDRIYNNQILAAPQGGIVDEHPNAIIGPNNITFNSFYANDYCIINYSADGQIINGNICHPTSGRGIDVESKNVQVTGNIITVTELPQVAEYKGCEGGGADGIRVRDNSSQANSAPIGVLISGNTIRAIATKCAAVGIRFTALRATDKVTLTGNNITTTGAGVAEIPDYAVSFDADDQPALAFAKNSFASRYAFVHVDWDGANVAIDSLQKWQGSPQFFIDNENGFYDTSHTGPSFAQSITVKNSTGGNIKCGLYAAGLSQFGPSRKICTAPPK